jgi:hypothetical protein
MPRAPISKNLANWDRWLRVAVAAGLIGLWWAAVLTSWLGIAAMVLAGGLLLNAAMGRCGLYAALGFSTCPLPSKPDADTQKKQ